MILIEVALDQQAQYKQKNIYKNISRTAIVSYVVLDYYKEKIMEKILLTVKEVCDFTGWGHTKVREIIKRPDNDFTIRMGNRLYVNKNKFETYLNRCAKYNIQI